MKTNLNISIESPDAFTFVKDKHEDYDDLDGREYAEQWHNVVVDWFMNIINEKDLEDRDLSSYNHSSLEDFYNENGELPNASINIKKSGDQE